jgi:hypothetical protein
MLKWLALLFMTIDHIGYYFFGQIPDFLYYTFRIVGRLAFPVFAFYIVKGFTRTRSPFRYLGRMAFWAVVAHLLISSASMLARRTDSLWNPEWTNVLVLFTFAITMLLGYDLAMRSYRDMISSMTLVSNSPVKFKDTRYDVKVNLGGISLSPNVGIAVGIIIILFSFWSVYVLKSDYEFYGLLTVLFIYISYNKEDDRLYLTNLWILFFILNTGYILLAVIAGGSVIFSLIQAFSMASIFLIAFLGKNERKPTATGKYFFYVFYPSHMAILVILSQYWREIIAFFAEILVR